MNKEEILKKHLQAEREDHSNIQMMDTETILAAMEEYASQFKSTSSPKWVKCSDRLPDIGTVCRKIGYTDLMDSMDFKNVVAQSNRIILSEWEWLDEQASPSSIDAPQELSNDIECEARLENCECIYPRCQCQYKSKSLSHPSPTSGQQVEELVKEIDRLKGLVSRMYNEFIRAAENTSPAVSENNWQQFKRNNNI